MSSNPYINPQRYLQAERKSLGEVFLVHDRQFVIPLNQRPWAWNDAKDIQLFLDDYWKILTAYFAPDSTPQWEPQKPNTRPPHFFGTFVFYQLTTDNKLEVFDGQQRITAVSMLCSILRELAAKFRAIQGPHQDDAGKIYGGFNEWMHVSPSVATRRLSVNTLFKDLFDALIFLPNDNSTRQEMVQSLPDNQRNHAISRKLISSFNYMRSWVCDRIENGSPSDNTKFLIASYNVLRYLFYCIETLILDEEYSYEVFGCLNNRGEKLTSADNIKNELFKVADKSLHKEISDRWDQMGENIPDQNIGEFLRRRHIALISSCKKQEIYSRIKNNEIDRFETKQLITDWHNDSKIVHRILQREANIADKETRQSLEYIFDVLNVSLAYIPILSAAKSFLPQDNNSFQTCVRVVECFVFRFLTIGQTDTTELERKLGDSARILADGGSAEDFRTYLQKQNNDLRFKTDFANHVERRKPVQYYILRELEKHLLGSGKGVVPGDHHKAKKSY